MDRLRPGGLAWNVVLAVHRLRGEGYGVTIREDIAARTGREVSYGAIYTTLSRLEQDGVLRSREGEKTPERGGRAKRFFELTGLGVKHLEAAFREVEQMRSSIGVVGGAI